MVPDNDMVARLVEFIRARERYREAKERRRKPRIEDSIIGQYRFCNVRRNDDRVTKWVHANYLKRWRTDDNLWFALTVARLFNNEETLAAVKDYVLPFKPSHMRLALHARADSGMKNFNAAYIVSTNGRAMNKVDYVIDCVLTPLWEDRKRIAEGLSVGQLANCHILLSGCNGLGSFMAAQVLADLKYAHPAKWTDFDTFAASGPGSRRGLNRVCGRAPGEPMREAAFRATLADLRLAVTRRLRMEPLTAQDIQNCLCEFDKYERVRLGEGTPKQLYKPKGE